MSKQLQSRGGHLDQSQGLDRREIKWLATTEALSSDPIVCSLPGSDKSR